MVHQELSLCPHLSVAENVLLGAEPASFGLLRRAEMQKLTRDALAQVSDPARDTMLRPEARVSDLSPAAAAAGGDRARGVADQLPRSHSRRAHQQPRCR